MSELVKSNDVEEKVELISNNGESIVTFHKLNCDVHGDGLSITDLYGSDFCVRCIEQMLNDKSGS